MSSNLPPLSALRSFVAVAQFGSVGAAAEALHVTHGAISHQVHALEAYLGVPLVERKARRTSVTEDGRIYAYQIRQALENIATLTQRLREPAHSIRLRVSVLPSFAMYWLAPRLSDWVNCHPDLQLSLEATMGLISFEAEPLDCAIRFGHGKWPDVHCQKLMGDTLLLVASPQLYKNGLPESVEQALAVPILQASESWAVWMSAACTKVIPQPKPALEFTDSTHMLDAARRGLGVALTRRSIASSLLESGDLVRITEIEVAHSSSYYLVWPNRSHKTVRISRFLDWLCTQVSDYESSLS